MKRLVAGTVLAAGPASAQDDYGFVSLANTDFIVLLAFLLFIGILVYFKVPGRLTQLLDNRAAGIRSDLDEARALREEAQSLLAGYERKHREVQEQADRIVRTAKEDATSAADKAKADLERTIARRVQSAEEQIESARDAALRDVRDRAIEVATAAAAEVLSRQIGEERARQLNDTAIETVSAKLN